MKKQSYKVNNTDILNYLLSVKNPLDKKFRWEVNTAFKKAQINDATRTSLLKVKDKDLLDLVQCIEQRIPVDKAQVGNYYYKRAVYLAKQRAFYVQKPLDFSQPYSAENYRNFKPRR